MNPGFSVDEINRNIEISRISSRGEQLSLFLSDLGIYYAGSFLCFYLKEGVDYGRNESFFKASAEGR